MALKRTKTYYLLLSVGLAVTCLASLLEAAPPHFSSALYYPRTNLTPFPGVPSRFTISMEGGIYVPPIGQTPGRSQWADYDFSYDYQNRSVTYTRRIKQGQTLTPVSSDVGAFRDRRLAMSLDDYAAEVRRNSLTKSQQEKAGGLFSVTVPIRSRAFESLFGEGGAGLQVSGLYHISFAGRSSWTDRQRRSYNKPSMFPTLNMEQSYNFNIKGTIGSKISVEVTQDSRNDLPLANRLILRYKGAEDDVLQSIEAGNTTLDLPPTQFLKYSTRVQGLFGIKATARLADLSITAIASQEKGSTETVSFSAGTSSQNMTVTQDINYCKHIVFDLGRLPAEIAGPDSIYGPGPYDFAPGDSIINYTLYLDDGTYNPNLSGEPVRIPGRCYISPNDTLQADPGGSYTTNGDFEIVSPDKYRLSPTSFYVQFLNRLDDNDILAIYMEVRRATNGEVYTIGSIPSQDTLRLKLIKPASHISANNHIWEYEWRNVYSLNSRSVDLTGLDVVVYKGKVTSTNRVNSGDLDNQGGVNYLRILGLDRIDASGAHTPDGKIDKTDQVIPPGFGLLIFPSRHPFASRIAYDSVQGGPVYLEDTVPQIYNSSNTIVVQESKYYLAITNTQGGSSVIDLNASNIIEGSEVVSYNGTRLVKGQDYNVNYDIGTLTLLNDEYTDLNSNLSVTYETAPYFSLSKKTLLGTRFEYSPSSNFKVGTTVLYKSDKSTNRKPKIGEETSRMLVWDADFSYHFENNVLTRMVDALPLVTSSAPSSTTLSGEIAQSRPNPNVDGQAFIDDFEGSRDSYSLGLMRSAWLHASRPVVVNSDSSELAKFAWYNPPENYSIEDIWNRDEGGANTAQVLVLRFEPVNKKKIPDVANNRYDTIPISPENSWNGFMRDFSLGTASQLQNVQLLELRVRGDIGIMHVDLGRISEDINGDGTFNTEDLNGNNILDEGEDIGLDGVADGGELGHSDTNPDPAGDNFFYSYTDFWKINGTEGNGTDPEKEGIPDIDKESQDENWSVLNTYFSYRIDLSDTTSDASFYVPGTCNDKGWKTIRIPLRDRLAIDTTVCNSDPDIGCPSWDQIRNARIWFDSASQDQSIMVEIAGLDLVSNVWADSLRVIDSMRFDTAKFDVAVINNEVDRRYTPPPGISGYYDPSTNLTEKEQSLLLSYENLSGREVVNVDSTGQVFAADTGLAVRQLYRASNYMGYGKIEAFVHGDDSGDSVLFFFRMGSDRDAYYEYRTVLQPGWAPENQILIEFDKITALKARLLEDRKNGDTSTVIYDSTSKYLVKIKSNGTPPSLTTIQYFSMGVVNLDTLNLASGEVWIDELRLTDVRDNVGMATRVGINGNISDLITSYSFNYSSQDAYYRGVSDATRGGGTNNLGSGQTSTNYSFSGTVKLDKLFPRAMQLTLPVSVNWSQNVQEPLLRSGTDITLPEDLKKNETYVSVSKGISASESIQKKTKNIVYNALLNRLNTSFNYRTTTSHSPTTPWSFNESYGGTANYTLTMRQTPSVQPLKWASRLKAPFGLSGTRLYLYPTALDFSGTINGGYSQSLNQSGISTVSSTRDFNGVMTIGYKVFDNLGGSYRMTTARDLKDPEKVHIGLTDFRFGVERNYTQDFRINYSPRMFTFLTHSADYFARYTDANNIINDSSSYHRADLTTNSSLSLELKHQLLTGTNKPKSVRRTAKGKPPSIASKAGKASMTGLRYVSSVIKPITFRIGYGEYRGLPALAGKASAAFRFGLSDEPGVRKLSSSTTWFRESKTVTKSIATGSGVSFFSGLGADVRYERSIRETFDINSTRSTSVTWPDLRFNLRSTRGLGNVGKIINAFSPSSAFSRTKDTEKRINLPYPSSERTRQTFSPLLSFTVNVTRAIRATGKVETTKSENTIYNESTGAPSTITRGSSSTYTFNGSYSFRNPTGVRLPLFGRLKFESVLSLAIDVSYQKSQEQQATPANKYVFTLTSKKTTLIVRPSANYSFSSTIKGSLSGRWQDSKDLYTRSNSHIREISISVEMRF